MIQLIGMPLIIIFSWLNQSFSLGAKILITALSLNIIALVLGL